MGEEIPEEVFIDSNVFLEIFLKDSKSEECKNFLRGLAEYHKRPIVSDFVLYSCLLILQNKIRDTSFMRNAITFITNIPNLEILRPSINDMDDAVQIMNQDKLDFDDSLVVACMRSNGITKLASLDRHFDKVKGIKRIEL